MAAREDGLEKDILLSIRPAVESIVRFAGMELVHMEARHEGGGLTVRLFIDREGGVTLDDCASISRQVGAQLDLDDPIPGRYRLEVSSPGEDRPLCRDGDFVRFAGRRVRVTTAAPIDGRRNFAGLLDGLLDGAVRVRLEDGREVAIPRDQIVRARLQPEPAPSGGPRGARGRHA